MAKNRPVVAKKSKRTAGSSRALWLGVGAAVIIFIVIAVYFGLQGSIPFEMTGGDDNPVVVLRNEATVYYEFSYTGGGPAVLERIIPRIQLYQDQVLVADVQQVSVRVNETETLLEEGYFPEGGGLNLNPGDTFEVGVTYLGQELGWNRIYGWRLQYNLEGRSVDGELELQDNYYVFVE